MAPARDFSRDLGVSRDADQDEIQRAYRRLARPDHPDVNKNPAAEDRLKGISEAYGVLSDPHPRRRYDTFGPGFRQVPEGVDPRARTRSRAGARGRRGGGPRAGGPVPGPDGERVVFDTGGGPDIDLDDLLGGFFSRGRGRSPFGPGPGADQEAELVLTLEEAYRGGRRPVALDGRRFDIDVPPGVTDGQRIRLAGQGGRGRDGAPPGDLYLVVRLAPD